MKVKSYRACDLCGRAINKFSYHKSDRYYSIKARDFESKRYKSEDRDVCGTCMEKIEYEVFKQLKEQNNDNKM